MARGTSALIGWLAVVSLVLIVVVTAALILVEPPEERNPFKLLWATFVSTFSLAVPADGSIAVLALWFVLALGGIFVVSALVGLLTNGMNQQLERLRKGRSVVVEHDHTVILGWSDQIFTVVAELIEANRSRGRSAVAILANEDKVEMEDRLRQRLGPTANTRLVCRTGSPLDLDDMALVNINQARSIIVLSPNTVSIEDADAYVIKTLLAIDRGPAFSSGQHHVVAAVRDGRNRAIARLAGGNAVVIDADDISARLVVQTARQSGLSAVYQDLLDFEGNEFYVVTEPRLVGTSFGQALMAYRNTCVVGLVNGSGTAVLNPPMHTVIGADDKLVLLAEDDSLIRLTDQAITIDESAIVHAARGPLAPERTLILGWNARAPKILQQLDIYVTAGSSIDIVTDRADAYNTVAQLSAGLRQLTAPSIKDGDIRDRTVLEQLDIATYANIIVLADDHLEPLPADSRVLVTLLHLRDILVKRGKNVSIVSEMRDDRDRKLAQLTRADDFVVSERLVSLLMTQISEGPDLVAVFTDLFDPDGAEIYIRPAIYYMRSGQGVTFGTLVESARRRGEVAIGYRVANPTNGHGVVLNPDKNAPMPAIDRLIVLAQN